MSTNYGIVRDKKVVEAPVAKPLRWNDIPGFYYLSDEALKTHGWYPCTVYNESYNPTFQNRSLPEMLFDDVAETVTVVYQVTDKPIEQIKAILVEQLKANVERALGELISSYPERETLSWAVQEREATAYFANNQSPTPLIDAIVATRNIYKQTLCEKIIEKSAQFYFSSGTVIGFRQKVESQIDEATTIEALKEVKVEVDLSELLAK